MGPVEAKNVPVISVRNVSKKFKIYQDRPMTLKERLLYRSKGVYQENWVLQDISLTIEKGKMVALIGRNGSGKSTLLKMMTRIIKPDQGIIKMNGRVSSLLELGAGFHADFTGRENIYFNASIFGLTRKEIDEKIDEIVAFSELEHFIDNPVRTYSSGMYMRLAFSVAIHVEPDILLIDEILAVGDNAFQKKCISKIEQFKAQGKTIVFVSHDNSLVERLCDEVFWIHESKVIKSGDPRDVLRDYVDFLADKEEVRMEKSSSITQEVSTQRWGDRSVEILEVRTEVNGQEKAVFEKGKSMIIKIRYKMHKDEIKKPTFGIGIFRVDGLCCYGTNTFIDNESIKLKEHGEVCFQIHELNLIEGNYFLDVACHHEDGTPYDYIKQVKSFKVFSYENEIGVAYLPHAWKIN